MDVKYLCSRIQSPFGIYSVFRSGTTGAYSCSGFSFLRTPWFLWCLCLLTLSPTVARVSFLTSLPSFVVMIVILTKVRWNLKVALSCFSAMAKAVEHLENYLSVLCISSFKNSLCSFIGVSPFYWLFCFLVQFFFPILCVLQILMLCCLISVGVFSLEYLASFGVQWVSNFMSWFWVLFSNDQVSILKSHIYAYFFMCFFLAALHFAVLHKGPHLYGVHTYAG